MKKQNPFPYTRILLSKIPADAIGLSPKTLQRRRKYPEKVTLEELQKLIEYAQGKGEAPLDLIRELIRKDLT